METQQTTFKMSLFYLFCPYFKSIFYLSSREMWSCDQPNLQVSAKAFCVNQGTEIQNVYSFKSRPPQTTSLLWENQKQHRDLLSYPRLLVFAVASWRSCRLPARRWRRSPEGCREPGSASPPQVPFLDCSLPWRVPSLAAQQFWGQGPRSHNLLRT